MLRTLPVLVALGAPLPAAAQADSTRADSALTRAAAPGSRTIVERHALRTFLADDPQHLLVLVPGVVLRGSETGLASAGSLSLRGGEPGGAAVYIDGAPVRFLIGGRPGVSLGVSSIDHIAVTTGPPDLSLPDLRNGVIEYAVRAGGDKLTGALSARTDEGFTALGFNRFEGGVGGPLPIPRATWFVGGTVTGQRQHFVGLRSEDVPSYVPAGIDTTVTRVVGGQTQSVSLPRFIDQRAYDWGTELRAHAKIEVSTRSGTRISLTGVANEVQERFFPGRFALVPSLYTGARATGRLLVANWHQRLPPLGGQPFALWVNASIASNHAAAGLLEPASELATVSPPLGITLETLRFVGADVIPTPLTDRMIRNVRTNSGLRVPFLNQDQLRNFQVSRGNPYGVATGWAQQGLDGPLALTQEGRTQGRLTLEWLRSATSQVMLGGDWQRATVSSYAAGSLLRQTSFDAHTAVPTRFGLFASYGVMAGATSADFSLRFDRLGGAGPLAIAPGRIYTNPAFNRPGAITDDTAYANSVARVMSSGEGHQGVSGRVAIVYRLGAHTSLRASLGRWLAPPPLDWVLLNSNADADFMVFSSPFGRDVTVGYAGSGEVGAAHQVGANVRTEVVLYWSSRPRYEFQVASFPDPANPGDTFNANVLTNNDNVMDIGFEAAFDWRVGSWLSSRATYAMRHSDYGTRPGPFGPLEVEMVSTHALTAAAIVRAPAGPLAGVEASVLAGLTSGTWYDQSFATLGTMTPPVDAVGVGDNARLPWTKRLDLRVARTVTVGASAWSFFVDARNLFGWRNILALFAQTGSVTDANHRSQFLAAELQGIELEALNNGAVAANGDILLPADCSTWTVTSLVGGAVVNCVALKRVEARFGNGDGAYSMAERQTTLDAFYNSLYGPHTFYGMGRSVRLGVEIRW